MKNELIIPSVAWITLTLLSLFIIVIGLKSVLAKTGWEKKKRTFFLFAAVSIFVFWISALLVLSYFDFFTDFNKMPPRPAIVLFLPFPLVLFFTFSKNGKELLLATPPQWLIYMQSFRIAVEMLLLLAFLKNLLPVQMTFEGRNFDILSGLLAIPAGLIISRKISYSKKVIWTYNLIGIVLLLNILVIAVLSMPTPIRYFMNEPANTIVAEFPFILLPGILVPIAYSFHTFSLRQLSLSASVTSES